MSGIHHEDKYYDIGSYYTSELFEAVFNSE